MNRPLARDGSIEAHADPRRRRQARRYLGEFLPAMLGYVLAVPLSLVLLQHIAMPTALKFVVALLPMLPAWFGLRAVLRHLRRLDELEQRIQTQAIGVASLSVGMLTFALGFLQIAGLLPKVAGLLLWVLPAMIAVWGVAVGVISYRYRHGQ